MSEAFHDVHSTSPSPCGCAWQDHIQQDGRTPRTVCRGVKYVDDNGSRKREPCTCTAVAPRHYMRRIIGADVMCNCGWNYETALQGEDYDNHMDRGVYI